MEIVEPIRNKEKIKLVKSILKKDNLRNYLLFVLGINCGLRISDLLRLKIKDVQNLDFIEIKEQKTGKIRKFPINNLLKSTIKKFITDKNPEKFLFQSRTGNRAITRIQAYRIINRACRQAGIDVKIGTHTLRKTFGYHFYKEKKDLALLQNILNHSIPDITLRYVGINQDIINKSLQSFNL